MQKNSDLFYVLKGENIKLTNEDEKRKIETPAQFILPILADVTLQGACLQDTYNLQKQVSIRQVNEVK